MEATRWIEPGVLAKRFSVYPMRSLSPKIYTQWAGAGFLYFYSAALRLTRLTTT